MNPQYLELEITESTIMQNEKDAGKMLRDLKSMGIKISVDDFGTGYSSLSYLKRFTLDALKIDRSFIKDLAYDADDRAITLAIIAMAHSLGLRVVAEGVKTEQHLSLLRDHGCDEVQGFLFSPPLQAEEFIRKVAEMQPGKAFFKARMIHQISLR
jgi:EAL domain-containing protein (putative c-di-GMP-specific phosphodiesterase class I)